ncbi:calcium:proton antiporter [Dokdonella koreensis]|uniref:Calcium/proton antiporter n=1 Tax=Dokdonella koreensis DS-123 TaxID=1300342 RepID=A0A160DU90_9GAMM|nr:ionic transporter y4hA [Dokdonella koreensis]ANB18005.1 Calcium/proton antiporter [Dokdonella koreensis DS-123]
MSQQIKHNPLWTVMIPPLGIAILGLSWAAPGLPGILALLVLGLVGSVIASVHHAEVIAHRVGEPFGTLVLALAVTVIEVALIVSMMLSGGESTSGLARDTVFAAVMIILNGIIGASLLVGGRKHHVQGFKLDGINAALGALTVIVVFTLIVPNYSTSAPGPVYTSSQLVFVAIATLVLFAAFTFFQTIRHRDYFLPADEGEKDPHQHAAQPTNPEALASLGLLLLALVAVVLSAKGISPSIEAALNAVDAPASTIGILIAAIVLLPESVAAIRAAHANRLQTSLNLAIGSAIASIGLTVPVVAVLAVVMGWPLALGLDTKSTLLLVLSLFVVSISLRTGRTTVLPGVVHLVIFAAYLFLSFVP